MIAISSGFRERWLDARLGGAHPRLVVRRLKYKRLDNPVERGRDPVPQPH